jgi:hypothetical protein
MELEMDSMSASFSLEVMACIWSMEKSLLVSRMSLDDLNW